MSVRHSRALAVVFTLVAGLAAADDWSRFRGGDGTGTSTEKNLPVQWSDKENVVWRTKLPGPGTSSPIVTGNRIFLSCYTGYGVDKDAGDMKNLVLHALCVDRKTGNILWDKEISPSLPEPAYKSYLALHGYASSTPATDGKHVYFFFGKTGVYCFDLDGKEDWHKNVGNGKHGWGSATSPILYKDTVIVNASVESGSLVALNKTSGEQVWAAKGVSESWSTPVLVVVPGGKTELVVSASHKILGFNPENGDKLWYADSFNWYVCPTVVQHDGVVYTLQNSTSVAVRCGGKGDVTKTHTLWQKNFGSTVSSCAYDDGYVYFCPNGTVNCLKADTGEVVYKKSLTPRAGDFYASSLVANGKIYFVSRFEGTYVVASGAKFEQVAHNVFADDKSRTNASPITDRGCILMRTDSYLYCLGKKT